MLALQVQTSLKPKERSYFYGSVQIISFQTLKLLKAYINPTVSLGIYSVSKLKTLAFTIVYSE